MSWKPVYHFKHTEEEHSTRTKTIETITKSVGSINNTLPNEYPLRASQSSSDSENSKNSGSSVITVVRTIREPTADFSDQFFEQLLNEAAETDRTYHAKPARIIPEDSSPDLDYPARTTYKDWKNLKEKILKDFQLVTKKTEEKPREVTKPAVEPIIKQPLRIVSYPKMATSSEKCRQQEDKMTDKLKEIHAMVEDVKSLSEKFPKLFVSKNSQVTNPNHVLHRCSREQKNITYISGIAFQINPRKLLN